MKSVKSKSIAICILGMHRSGTSSITRAINLLGAYLGEEAKISGCGPDNPLGFWEHPDIVDFHVRLLAQLGRSWDIATPLPDHWHQSETIRPFKEELATLIKTHFAGRSLWAWKDPRTCLFMALWREVLDELDVMLVCLFMARNPVDVSKSLNQRESVAPGKALGVWFNYNIFALRDTAGVPTAFICYDQFLSNWEAELRRCATILNLNWPANEPQFRTAMNGFIRPDLRHNCSPPADLENAPHPVRELYELLYKASTGYSRRDEMFDETVNRLSREFHAYASFFPPDTTEPRPGRIKRTWRRWQKSLRKRLSPQMFPAITGGVAGR